MHAACAAASHVRRFVSMPTDLNLLQRSLRVPLLCRLGGRATGARRASRGSPKRLGVALRPEVLRQVLLATPPERLYDAVARMLSCSGALHPPFDGGRQLAAVP